MKNTNYYFRIILAFTLLLIYPITLDSQDIKFPQLNKFDLEMNYPVYTPDNLWDYINGGADSYNALGFQDLQIAEYNRGKHSIKVEVYQHATPEQAFGIYALERAPSYDFFELGVQGYREEGLVHFLKGEYYVKITSHSDKKRILEALEELAYNIESMLEGSSEFPPELQMFPAKAKVRNSEMYISESVMGHEFLNNAFRADYTIDDNRFSIYLFSGNNRDENHHMLSEYLSKYDLEPGSGPGKKYSFEDGYNGYVYLKWQPGLVILISGLDKDSYETANEYINDISER